MANVIPQHVGGDSSRSAERQAYQLLHWGFVAAPVIAGLDKFSHLLTNWNAYLAPIVARLARLAQVHDTPRRASS